MLLMEYAKTKGLLKSKFATVVEVRNNGSEVTLIYKVDGQKYANGQYSAKTLTKQEADTVEVDKDSGRILNGTVLRKNNFWVWQLELSDEA